MPDSFKFNAYNIGRTDQYILFLPADAVEQRFEVPDLVVPEDTTERFHVLYNKLVELGAIEDRTPTYAP